MIKRVIAFVLAASFPLATFADANSELRARQQVLAELVETYKSMSPEERTATLEAQINALKELEKDLKRTELAIDEARKVAEEKQEKFAKISVPASVVAIGGLVLAGYGVDHMIGRANYQAAMGKPIVPLSKLGKFGFVGAGLVMLAGGAFVGHYSAGEYRVAVNHIEALKAEMGKLTVLAILEMSYLDIMLEMQ